MKKQFKLKKLNGRSFQMFGIVSVILATLVSFAYLMPENSTASETALVPAVTIVTSTSATTTVTSSTSTTLTTSKTVTATSSVSTTTTATTSTSLTSTTTTTITTTKPETVSSSVTATTSETTTAPVTEILYIAENTETVAGEADESSFYDEDYEESDKQYEYDDDESGISGERIYLGTFKITHYCACSQCCGESTGLTASGTYATAGRTVGASSAFDFGTQLEIDGHVYVVEDRGGFSENTIDIFCDSHEEALEKGSYYTDVYIIAD